MYWDLNNEWYREGGDSDSKFWHVRIVWSCLDWGIHIDYFHMSMVISPNPLSLSPYTHHPWQTLMHCSKVIDVLTKFNANIISFVFNQFYLPVCNWSLKLGIHPIRISPLVLSLLQKLMEALQSSSAMTASLFVILKFQ